MDLELVSLQLLFPLQHSYKNVLLWFSPFCKSSGNRRVVNLVTAEKASKTLHCQQFPDYWAIRPKVLKTGSQADTPRPLRSALAHQPSCRAEWPSTLPTQPLPLTVGVQGSRRAPGP